VDKGLCLPEILEAVLITRIINGEEVRIDPGAIIGPEMIDLPPWTMGSLFAGIGGFDLGFERAGFKTKWQVEIDPYCRKVLEKHFPHAKRYNDVREVGAHNLEPVDVICGGFPCQDISNAGKRAGIEGERSGLWSEYARIVGELRPRFVVVENVAALLGRGIGRVLGDLAEIGYDAEWEIISAADVGAPHLRERVWIVAYPDALCLRPQGFWPSAEGPWSREQFEGLVQTELRLSLPSGKSGGVRDGVSGRVHRLKALGNAVVPQIPELIARRLSAVSA
jgi:DNA (cytosine-5)-methyltransferase 1